MNFPRLTSALSLAMIASAVALGATENFSVPDDVALRIRLDDTLTSADSIIGDPFSATVVDRGDYQDARVYGHIAEIDPSGKLTGHTTIMLRFDRLVMPDGRRAPGNNRLPRPPEDHAQQRPGNANSDHESPVGRVASNELIQYRNLEAQYFLRECRGKLSWRKGLRRAKGQTQ